MRLLLILGPPAVGKMTVGRAVANRSDFRLFHNHHSIEMLLDVFDYGTPPFRTLNAEVRRRVVEEAAAAGADRTTVTSPRSSWSPTSTRAWSATGPSTGWPRRSPNVTSSGPTPMSSSSRRSTG